MASKIFKKYYSRLMREGFFKSLFCGLSVGFTALLISALICWITDFKHVWICAIIWAAVSAAATPLFYYKRFRPSVKAMMKRIDELGLEERMLTMAELEGDDSFIAMKQREDAMKALSTVNASLLKFAVSVPMIVALAVSAVLGAGMTTVSALSASDKIKSGNELIDNSENSIVEYEVMYDVEGEGYIEGEMFQLVASGEDATGVLAVAEDGWVFISWSDGLGDPYREDLAVSENLTLIAMFEELEEGEKGKDGDGDNKGENNQQTDSKDGEGKDKEADEGDGQPEKEQQSQQDQEGDKNGKGDGQNGKPQPKPEGEGDGAGGESQSNDMVYDGATDYKGSTYDNAYDKAMEEVSQDGDLTDEGKDAISDYFDNIEN